MEKYIVLGPIILFLGFFALLIIGFLGFIARLFMKGKNQAWIGTVIEKVVFEKKDDDSKRVIRLFSLKIQLENGELHSIPATEVLYNKVKEGDKLEKKKGALWPEKI